jgi:hypothetical protein
LIHVNLPILQSVLIPRWKGSTLFMQYHKITSNHGDRLLIKAIVQFGRNVPRVSGYNYISLSYK